MEFFAPDIFIDILGLPKIELFSMPIWYWIFIFLLSISAFLVGHILSKIILQIICFFYTSKNPQKRNIFGRLNSPIRLFSGLLIFVLCESYLDKPQYREITINTAIKLVGLIIFAHACFRIIDFIFETSNKLSKASTNQVGFALLRHTLKILVITLCALIILGWCGVDINKIFLGLGLGGLGVALALRPVLENLFSGALLAWDNIFKIGECVQIDQEVGTIEDINMRSLKLRTYEGPLVTIPNAQIINSHITNFSRRSHRRLKIDFKILRSYSESKILKYLDNLRRILNNNSDLNLTSLRMGICNIEVNFYEVELVATIIQTDINFFTQTREQVCLHIGALAKSHRIYPPKISYIKKNLYI